MRTRTGLCYPRVVEDKNMRVMKRRRDFAAEQASYRKRSRNSSDIAGRRDLFDSLPDDLVISILCKLSSSATCPFDFDNVLLTCRRLNGLVPNSLEQIRQRLVKDSVDWRSQLQPESRQRIVNKIIETLKRHLPVSGQEGLHELRKIAIRFEEKIYTAATSQSDYLRKISLKMLTMEANSQNPIGNALPSNSAGNSNKSPDAGKRKKVRKREAGELINASKVSKKGIAMKCGNCFQWGHNQRTCKAPDNPNKKAYKKKKKGQSGQSSTSGAKWSKKLLGTQQSNIGTQQSSQSRTKDNTSGSKKDKGKAKV